MLAGNFFNVNVWYTRYMQNISNEIKPSPKLLRWFFFLSGVIATIAYRIIFLLDSYWITVVWYVGTIGFILYFGHRWHVENKRAKMVKEYHLANALENSDISAEKKVALLYLIKTSVTSKVRYNSLFIFVASLVALMTDILLRWYRLYY